jgi:hypothetical protein
VGVLLHLGRWASVFGVVGIFAYVCVCRILWVRDVAPPTVRSKEQVAVASLFLADTLSMKFVVSS